MSKTAEHEPQAPADELARELASLRDVQPPSSLVARVMTRVATPAPSTFWHWLRRPLRFELRISPVGALLLAMGLAGAGALVIRTEARRGGGAEAPSGALVATRGPAKGESARSAEMVMVRFVFEGRGARQVSVAGSFNDWKPDALALESADHDGMFVATIALPRGVHEYMFVVDGKWVADPMTSARRPDGFGRQNSVLRL